MQSIKKKKKSTSRHMIVKLMKKKHKEKCLNIQEKRYSKKHSLRAIIIKLIGNFSLKK
jgi:hypothetical protein